MNLIHIKLRCIINFIKIYFKKYIKYINMLYYNLFIQACKQGDLSTIQSLLNLSFLDYKIRYIGIQIALENKQYNIVSFLERCESSILRKQTIHLNNHFNKRI